MLAFLLASLLIELTPGPNMTWLAALGASRGRPAALAAVAGIAIGLAFAGAVAGFGLSAIVGSEPWLFNALRWAGAFYLLYLAYDAWRDSAKPVEVKQDALLRQFFMQGLIGNILNPKAYLFYAAVLPQFMDSAHPIAGQVATLTVLYVAVATAVHSVIALLSGNLAPWLSASPNASRVRRALAIAIAATAVWFLYSTRLSQ